MVELDKVKKVFDGNKVLDNLSFSFNKKGLYVIKGNNGVGKTTLLNIISSRIKDYKGKVSVSDSLFYLSLESYLIEEFSVKDNININKDLFSDFKPYKNDFGIEKLMNKKVNKLSKGERQRVGLYIALSSGCKIVLLDEVLSGVDSNYKEIMINELKEVSSRKLIIVVSHLDIKGKKVKNIYLDNGKLYGEDNGGKYKNKVIVNKLKNNFKWANKAHSKQWISKCVFIISLISLLITGFNINREILRVDNEFEEIFINESIVYKKSNYDLNFGEFYKRVVRELAYYINDYYYDFYSEEMYDAKVVVGDNFVDNGYLFSHVLRMEGLKENEIVLEINDKEYCLKNSYLGCYKSQIKDSLVGRYLSYKFKDKEIKFLIKDVIFSSENRIYFSDLEMVISKLMNIHKNKYINYYVVIYKEQRNNFQRLINDNDVLLNYNFDFLDSKDDLDYYLVSSSEQKYFSMSELRKNNLIACSDIGISCSGFNLLNFNTLMYIDEYDVYNKIKYHKIGEELEYDEVIISSSLGYLLGKRIGDTIDLKFYINDLFYNLENVKIKDIEHDSDMVIYHDKYDFDLYNDEFNVLIRSKYAYGKEHYNYEQRETFDHEYIQEIKTYLSNVFKILNIGIYCMNFILIIILFVIETIKLKKHERLFELIIYNNGDYRKFYFSYMSFYLICSIMFLFDYIMLILYLFGFLIFYLYNKRKIKSRFPWI